MINKGDEEVENMSKQEEENIMEELDMHWKFLRELETSLNS